MYKATVRWLIRRNITALNRGNHRPSLAMYSPNAQFTFPGDNTWSNQFRHPVNGREGFATHRDRDEIAAFLERYVGHRIRMSIEDILVNGPPWKTRVAVRAHVWASGPDGQDIYTNRAVLMLDTRWGRIRRHEDYEDTEHAAAFDHVVERPAYR